VAKAQLTINSELKREETLPLLTFYRERGILVDVPGDDTIDEVNRRIVAALEP
jgi:adenylate kinase family enzyme